MIMEISLTREEAIVVRKVLQCANQLFTVMDTDFHPNKVDELIRKLREFEACNSEENAV